MASTASPQQASCRFLQVPPELRNQIYDYVFVPYEPKKTRPRIVAIQGHRLQRSLWEDIPICKALLLTCRSVHSDTKAMYTAACRTYMSEGAYTFFVRAGDEDRNRLDGVPDDVLIYAGKIKIIFTDRTGSRKYEVVKQKPDDGNGWMEWDVKGKRWVDDRWEVCDPRPQLKLMHAESWEKLLESKKEVYRKTGKHGEGVMRMELEWIIAAGAAGM